MKIRVVIIAASIGMLASHRLTWRRPLMPAPIPINSQRN